MGPNWVSLPTVVWERIFDLLRGTGALEYPLQATCKQLRRLLLDFGRRCGRFVRMEIERPIWNELPMNHRFKMGPFQVLLGNLGIFVNKHLIYTNSGPDFTHCYFDIGPDGALKHLSAQRLKIYMVQTLSPRALMFLGLKAETMVYYSAVILSIPVLCCAGKRRGTPSRDMKLNLVYFVSTADLQGRFLGERRIENVFHVYGGHPHADRPHLRGSENRLIGSICVTPAGVCSKFVTKFCMRLRPLQQFRTRILSLKWTPLYVDTLASELNTARLELDRRRQSRAGFKEKHARAAALRLSRLFGRFIELVCPGYKTFHGNPVCIEKNDLVKIRFLRRLKGGHAVYENSARCGTVQRVNQHYCKVKLARSGKIVCVHRDYIEVTGRPSEYAAHERGILAYKSPVVKNFATHLRNYICKRHRLYEGIPGSVRVLFNSDEWDSQCTAIYEEANVLRDFLRSHRGFTVQIDLFQKFLVKLKKLAVPELKTKVDLRVALSLARKRQLSSPADQQEIKMQKRF